MSAPRGNRIYQSDTLALQVMATADTTRWVVTFDHMDIAQGFERDGFAQSFLHEEGVSALHFMGVGPDWYQYPDLEAAIAVARRVLGGADTIMAYGSSMGGYAALRLGPRLGANTILAVSPQYTIEPEVVPFERRWLKHGRRLRFVPAMRGHLKTDARPLVIYDPMGLDRHHVRLIEQDIEIRALALPFCGHPAMTYLHDTGELKRLVLETLSGCLDLRALHRRLRAARHTSGVYFSGRAAELQARRPALAVASGERAVALSPHSDVTLLWLARAQRENGQFEASLETHRRLCELCGPRFTYVSSYVRTLIAAGRNDQACSTALAYIALGEGQMQSSSVAWAASVARSTGDLRTSLSLYWHAYRLEPDAPDARRQWVLALWRLSRAELGQGVKALILHLRDLAAVPVWQERSVERAS